MKTLTTTVTYLEMLRPPPGPPPGPPDVDVARLASPSVGQYCALYERVGRDYHWTDRLRMPEESLRAILQNDAVEIYLLRVGGQTAGYSELDRRVADEVELAYFGLCREFTGRGLGRWFLSWTVHRAWRYRPKRVWLHTCDLDHPAALPLYLQAGFTIYDRQVTEQVISDE